MQHFLLCTNFCDLRIKELFVFFEGGVLSLQVRVVLLQGLKLALDGGQFRLVALQNATLLDLRFGPIIQDESLHQFVALRHFFGQLPDSRQQLAVLLLHFIVVSLSLVELRLNGLDPIVFNKVKGG